ncbi:hypothetical protein PG988_006299 [Apiospora saccharicola]
MEEPIAIVGLDARVPGGDNPDAFFDFLCSGRSARSAVPTGRFHADAFVAPGSSSGNEGGRIVSTHGHFLEGSIHAFDAPFFSITAAEAAGIDPQQRNLLETVYKALENAGIPFPQAVGTRTGVYVGCSSADFRDMTLRDLDASLRYAGTGTINSMLSNRVSWFYDFTGPSMTIDTACSSSLVAVHQAVMALRNGSISMAVTGGTNLLLSPEITMSFTAMGVLSPDGISLRGLSCPAIRAVIRNSSINQDGHSPALTHSTRASLLDLINTTYSGLDMSLTRFIEAHGTGTRVGDPIEAGAIADAFAAHRSAHEPMYVGAMKSSCGHLEGAAGLASLVKAVLSLERGIIPGNSWFEKPNPSISPDWHLAFPTEPVSWPRNTAVANTGLRRASVNCLGLGGTNAHVVLLEVTMLILYRRSLQDDALHFLQEHGSDRSPGLGNGWASETTISTSAHDDKTSEGACRSEERETAPSVVASGRNNTSGGSKLFVFTANDRDGVSRLRQAYERHLSGLKSSTHTKDSKSKWLRDLSFTLSAKRTQFPWRAAVVANSVESLRISLGTTQEQDQQPGPVRSESSRRLALVFTGQGTQWPTMGMGLMVAYPIFRQSMEKADDYLKGILGSCWSLIYELTKKGGMSRVDEAEFSQPLCTALQVALVDLMTSWGVTADAVVGHSSGEIAATYAAKAISAEDAWRIAYYRGKLAAKLIKTEFQIRTGMAAVGLGYDEATAAIQDLGCGHFQHPGHLEVACFNSQTSHTISGELDRINALVAKLNDEKVFARKLKVEVGYHSQYMQPIADEYAKMIGHLGAASIPMRDSTAPRFYSSTIGAEIDASKLQSAAYWVDNMVSPVQFQQSLTAMLTEDKGTPEDGFSSHPITDVLEIGPHRGLKGPIGQTSKSLGLQDFQYHGLMESNSDNVSDVLRAAGTLFSRGLPIDISLVNEQQDKEHCSIIGPNMLTNLPSYPFNHTKEYWSESRLSKAFAHRQHGRHEVLGTPVAHNSSHNSMWHHWLRLSDIAWLKDHQVGESILFPAAGMLAMAVEAAHQVAAGVGVGVEEMKGFRLRHVSFLTALHMPNDGTGVETYFYLKEASSSSREWKEFQLWTVSQDNEWLEHCRGLILVEHKGIATTTPRGRRAGREGAPDSMDSPLTPHITMANVGPNLSYQSHPAKEEAREEGVTMLHPTMIDGILQAGLAPLLVSCDAKCPGRPWVPVGIEEFWISAHSSLQDSIMIPVRSDVALNGRNEARSSCTAMAKHTGKPLVLVDGLVWKTAAALSTTNNTHSNSNSSDHVDPRHKAWNMEWKPDVTLLCRDELKSAFRPGEEPDPWIYTEWDDCNELAARYISRALQLPDIMTESSPNNRHVRNDSGIELPPDEGHVEEAPMVVTRRSGHLDRYVELMKLLVAGRQGKEDPGKASSDSIETLEARVAAKDTSHAKLVLAVGRELTNVLDGTVDPLEILFGANTSLAEQFYQTGYGSESTSAQLVHYLDILAHKNPLMKMLEVGAGTGGTAKPVLDRLASRYRGYDFTDVSAAFLEKAKRKFSHVERMNYRLLDIERDPWTQGFELGTYDVVMAAHVLHATQDIVGTLQNCRALLKPGGKLLLTENMRPATMLTNFVFGLFPGWWRRSENDDRIGGAGPLLSAEAWERYVLQSGFTGLDAEFPDYADEKHRLSSVLVCSAPDERTSKGGEEPHGSELPRHGRLLPGHLVIVADPVSEFQNQVVEDFKSSFTRVMPRTLADIAREDDECINQDSTCIVLTELEAPTLSNMSEDTLVALKCVFRCRTVLWLIKTGAPELEVARGFAACVRLENPQMRWITVSFEEPSLTRPHSIAETSWRVLDASLEKTKPVTDDMDDDTFRFTDGLLHIPRLVEAKYLTDYMQAATKTPEVVEAEYLGKDDPERALRLQIKDLGLLDTLRFEEDPRSAAAPLADCDVEVQTMASGVNFYDLSVMLGRIEETPLGVEGAGVVTTVGARVTRFRTGDRVFGFAFGGGAFRTPRFRTQEGMLARMPDHLLSFAEAAAMPLVYSTAYACLFDVGDLGKEESGDGRRRPSVLIHAAAGGVGQAAIQLAQRAGAEIYATVGSLEKRDFLEKTYHIPRDHIFSSRDLTFRDGVIRMTQGRGVDIILNSLSGDALRATWDCIAPFGRFAEMGLVDINARADISMGPFRRNARFEAVELHYMAEHAPHRLEDLLQRTVRAVFEQRQQPDGRTLARSTPITVYPFSEVQNAMRHMQSGKHIGKLVLEPRSGDLVPMLLSSSQSRMRSKLDGSATYVVAGGLGGLGRAVVLWMIEMGARYLLLLSRRGLPQADVDDMFHGMKGRLCVGHAAYSGLCSRWDGSPTLDAITNKTHPLQDVDFKDMTIQDWQDSVQVKVTGSKNLWTVLSEMNNNNNGAATTEKTTALDFFIMLSSVTSILGNPGQSNYVAGNAFQDAFAQDLARQGHPAVSINIPMLSDVGFVAERPELMHHLRRDGWPYMSSRELLAALEYYCFQPDQDQQSSPGASSVLTRHDRVVRAQVAPRLWIPRPLQTSGQIMSSWDKNPLLQPLKLWQHSSDTHANRHGNATSGNPTAWASSSAKDRLASVKTLKEAQEVVLEAFLGKLSRILSVEEAELSAAKPLHAYGVDSLVAVELRSWFSKEVGLDVTVHDMTSQGSIRQVAELVATRSASFGVDGGARDSS